MGLRAEALALLAVLAVSFFGWGRAFRRTLGLEPGSWPASIALGMAGAVFLGGILNALHLARTVGLSVVLVLGLVLAATLPRGMQGHKPGAGRAAIPLFIALLLAFPIWTQLPPQAFNFHDDFGKYFTHVTRLLQTGTANGGGPFSAIGFDTLGGQAYLQAIPGAFLPMPYINGLDAVFGFFLCLVLAVEFAAPPPRDWLPAAAIAALSVIAINPQYVNVSALYTGSALIMAALAIATDARELSANRRGPHPIATGLLFAALIALKTTFVLFAALLLPLVAVPVARVAGGIGKATRWTATASISAAVFLAPWVVPHLSDMRMALSRGGASGAAGQPVEWSDIFSTEALPYGSSMAAYTILVTAVFSAGIAAAWVTRHREPAIRFAGEIAASAGVALLAAYGILILLIAPRSYGLEHALRLFVPLALAVFPAVMGIAARHWPKARPWIVLAAVLVLIPFAPSFTARLRQAFTSGSVLGFSWLATDADYLANNRRVLDGPVRKSVAQLQQAVPPGEPILAWVEAPFYLDYARNPIIDVQLCGLCDAHAALPPFCYAIWAYRGYSIENAADYEEQALDPGAPAQLRTLSARRLDLLTQLVRWKETGRTLYDDGSNAVIRLGGQCSPTGASGR